MLNKKILIIISILLLGLLLLLLYGLHIRIVMKADLHDQNYYTSCDTIELHNLRFEKNTSDNDTDITCFKRINIWWAI